MVSGTSANRQEEEITVDLNKIPLADPAGFPLHVQVGRALEPDVDIVIGYPQNIALIREAAAFPTATTSHTAVWYWRHRLDPNHDCPYAWEDEPCECAKARLERIPRYDEDWRETGPLIEKLRIDLRWHDAKYGLKEPHWMATRYESAPDDEDAAWHPSLLVAVCALILALHASGKLSKPKEPKEPTT